MTEKKHQAEHEAESHETMGPGLEDTLVPDRPREGESHRAPPSAAALEDTFAPEQPPTVQPEVAQRDSPPAIAALPLVQEDSYQIAGEFARGGLGRILSARDAILDRPVALKELLVGDPAAAERFLKEALTTARLQHPNIVPVYEAGRWPNGAPFYAMKMVSGRSLDRVIRDARTLEGRLALIPNVLAVAEAIAYAHQQRIIHRDLKPGNILIGSFGETVVIDWGLTKDLADPAPTVAGSEGTRQKLQSKDGPHTLDGSVMGTPSYMPPEQASGESVDERADVYALGAVLYHVLSGRPPYQGESGHTILRAVLAGPPVRLDALERGVPGDLIAITEKAMARDPADRYHTAKELADDLRRFQTGQLVGAHRYSPSELALRWIRKNLALVLVAAAALTFFAIGAALSVRRIIVERDRANRERAAAEIARTAEMDRHDELVLVEARHALETDPTAALAWLRRLSPESKRWNAARIIAADARDRGVAAILQGHEGRVYRVVFAPNGERIASWGEDRTLRIWDLGGHAISVVRDLGATSDIRDGAIGFTPDGRSLWARLGGTIAIFDAASARKTFETPRAKYEESDPRRRSVTEDGARIAIASGPAISVIDVRTGERRELRETSVLSTPEPLISPDGQWIAIVSDQTIRAVPLAAEHSVGAEIKASMKSEIHRVRFSSDSRRLACAARLDREIVVLDLGSGEVRVLRGHTDPVRAFELSRDGKLLASVGSFDGTVRVWNVDAGTNTARKADPSGMAFSPDGKRLAMAIANQLSIVDLTSNARIDLRGHSGEITAIGFAPDGRRLATADFDQTVRVWDISRPTSLAIAASEAGDVPRFAVSPDGKTIAIATKRGGVRFADLETGALEPELMLGSEHRVAALEFSPDGAGLMTADPDGTIKRYTLEGQRAAAPRLLCRVTITPDLDLAFSRDGRYFATSGPYAPETELCELSTGRVTRLGARGLGLARALAFSWDGKKLATAGRGPAIRVFDTTTSSVVRELRGGESPIGCLTFSPDGSRLATGDEHDIRIWDPARGTAEVLRGHRYVVTSLAFSSDGAALASSADDWTVRMWDLESKEARALLGHARQNVSRALFTPRGSTIVSSGDDGTIRIWRDDLPKSPAELSAWIAGATNVQIAPDGTLRSTEAP